MIDTVIVLAKRPVAGRVKTRLTPDVTYSQAAELAAAALADTLHTAATIAARRHLLAFDGNPDGWLPSGWHYSAQPAGTLDVRLTAAFAAAGSGSALLVGMDTPQLTAEAVATFDPRCDDACLGLARDGGYWAIGFRDATRAGEVIPGVPMSTDRTGADQLARLRASAMSVRLLPQLTDVDTYPDAEAVAALVPSSRFASALRNVRHASRTPTPAGAR